MADPEHVGILEQSVAAWNKWCNDNPDIRPDLRGADLRGTYHRGADLRGADFSGANLSGADLSEAKLSSANLSGTDLSGAYLRGADLSEADLSRAKLSRADLSGIDLSGANLSGTDLSGGDLSGTDLSEAKLSRADLSWAKLSRAKLSGTDLRGTDLSGTDLSGAALATAKNLTQEQIDAIRLDPDFPPNLPDGLELPEMGDNGEKTAHPNTPEKGDTPLRAHPGERIILSGQLATPTAQLRRKVSKQELEELRDLLAACVPDSTPGRDDENVRRVPFEQESLDLLITVVNTGIELHKAPSYPQGLIDALLGLGACLRFFKSSSDWTPLPKTLQDKIGSTVNAYDDFLTELGLI